MQVARIGVQHRHLLLPRSHHTRVTVPHVAHVVDRVKVGATVLIVQVLHPAAHNLERLAIRDTERWADMLRPHFTNLLTVALVGRKKLHGNTHDEVRIGTQAQPDIALARKRHTGEIAYAVEQVGDDLQVQVRWPAAINEGAANFRKRRTPGDWLALVKTGQRVFT